MSSCAYLIVNFGGPRSLKEVEPFLRSLLTDKEVIRTKFPRPVHNFLFGRIAKKRAKQVSQDYAKIGGGSPIWADTEFIAEALREKLQAPVLTFHRYLPTTHADFVEAVQQLKCDEVRVFPMFPQFTYATTGSIARLFEKLIDPKILQKFRWVKSYPTHPAYIRASQNVIREYLDTHGLTEKETLLLFSAHGLPKRFVECGDIYAYECRLTVESVMKGFPEYKGLLCFQSKFGPGEWLRPYTEDVSRAIKTYAEERQKCVFIPISFTSDHIETLFEVEEMYMPLVRENGLEAFRVPALNRRSDWVEAIVEILTNFSPSATSMLQRPRCQRCPRRGGRLCRSC